MILLVRLLTLTDHSRTFKKRTKIENHRVKSYKKVSLNFFKLTTNVSVMCILEVYFYF